MMWSAPFFVSVCFIIIWFFYWIGGGYHRDEQEKIEKEKEHYRFVRLNEVKGKLYVDGKTITTYNIGDMTIGDIVGVSFFQSGGGQVDIFDISFKDQSLYAYAPLQMSYREKADYAIQTLKQVANQKGVPHDLVLQIEEYILEVDILNEYLKQGSVYQLQNDALDYAWRG